MMNIKTKAPANKFPYCISQLNKILPAAFTVNGMTFAKEGYP